MAILAFVESLFRTDFIIRCELKKSDKLSIRYRHTYNPAKRIYTYSYHDNYRNWLAHGRYWQFKDNPAKYKIEKIRNLAHRIQTVFGSELKFSQVIGQLSYVNHNFASDTADTNSLFCLS